MKRFVSFAIAAVLALGLSRANAEEDETTQHARELFKKAEVHFSVGEFARALVLYKEAFKTKSLPAFLFNIGQCHRNMGRCDRALFFFKQYLIRTPDAPNKADVEALIAICDREVAEGKKPAPEEKRVEKAPEAAQEPGPVQEAPPSRRRLAPLWFWSSAGLAGALLVAGTVTGVAALNKSDEYTDPSTDIERRRDLKDSGETLRTVSTATFVAGAVAAVGAGVLFFVTDWGQEQRAAVSAGPLPGGAALFVGGRF